MAGARLWLNIRPAQGLRQSLQAISESDRESVLVVATTALGDAVCCLPLIESIRSAGARVGFFVRRQIAPLFAADPRLAEVIGYPGKYRRMREVVRRIRAGGWRTALLCNMNDPDIVPLLLAGGVRTFLRRRARTSVFKDLVANPEDSSLSEIHAVDGALELGERIGIPPATRRPVLILSDAADAHAQAALGRHGLSTGFYGLHPGSYFAFKQWDAGSYAEILKHAARWGRVVLTGVQCERGLCQAIIERSGVNNAVNLAGQTAIDVTAAIIRRMKFFVSPDTGVAHIAFALGTPTVTIYFTDAHTLDMNKPLHDPDRHRVLLKPSVPDVIAECAKLK